MHEPTYRYERGKGWQVSPPFESLVTYSKGGKKKLTIEHRTPVDGEVFVLALTCWNIHDVAAHCQEFTFDSYIAWSEREKEIYTERRDLERMYAVIVEDA